MNHKLRWQQLLCTCEEQRARQVRQGRQVPRSCLGSPPLTGWGWFWWDIPKTFFFHTGWYFITVPPDFQYQNEIQPVWLQTAPGILLGHRFNVSLSMVQDRRLCCFWFHPSRCCPSCCYWLFLWRHWCSCRWRFLCRVFGNACSPILGQLHIVRARAGGGRHCLADSATTIMLIVDTHHTPHGHPHGVTHNNHEDHLGAGRQRWEQCPLKGWQWFGKWGWFCPW